MITYEQHTFAGGQLDRDLMGRQDLQKYFSGASVLKNFTVRRQGCISKRRGTEIVCDITALVSSGVTPRLIPFEFERDHGYYLLFVPGKVYFIGPNGVRETDGEYGPIARSLHAAWQTTPYGKAYLAELNICQSGDVVFITHPNYPPAKVTRDANGNFSYEKLDFGETANLNKPDSITCAKSGFTGTGGPRNVYYCATCVVDGLESLPCDPVQVTYNLPWANTGVVKITVKEKSTSKKPDYYKIYKKSGADFGLIGTTENSSDDTLSVEDDCISPDTSESPPTSEEHFNEEKGYPTTTAIHQQRLCFASSKSEPFKFWMSMVGNFYCFDPHKSIQENDCIEAEIAATRFPRINHMVSSRDLVLFCDNGEWVISPVTGNTLSYKTVSVKMQSAIGCSPTIAPVVAYDEILFVERSRTAVRSIKYNFSQDGYQSQDLSVLASDIFRSNRIVSISFQQYPDSHIWCVLEDGSIAVMTYMPEQEVVAWQIFKLAGNLKAVNVATNNALDGTTTEMAILAEVDGKWLILRARPDEDTVVSTNAQAVEEAICLDAMKYARADLAERFRKRFALAKYDTDTGAVSGTEDADALAIVKGADAIAAIESEGKVAVDFRTGEIYTTKTGIKTDGVGYLTGAAALDIIKTDREAIVAKTWQKSVWTQDSSTGEWTFEDFEVETVNLNEQEAIVILTPVLASFYTAYKAYQKLSAVYGEDAYLPYADHALNFSVPWGVIEKDKNASTSKWVWLPFDPAATTVPVYKVADGTIENFSVKDAMKYLKLGSWIVDSSPEKVSYWYADHVLTAAALHEACIKPTFYTNANLDEEITADEITASRTGKKTTYCYIVYNETANYATVEPDYARYVIYDTKSDAAKKEIVGLPFEAEFETVHPEVQGQQSIQFEMKNAKSIDLRIERGCDFMAVAHGIDTDKYATRVSMPVTAADGVVTHLRKDVNVPLSGNNTGDGRVRVIVDGVWPMTILSLGLNCEAQPLNNSEG